LFKKPGSFVHPLLFTQGTQDRLTSVPANEELFGKLGAEDKKFEFWGPDVGHELHREASIKDALFKYYVDWLNSRSA
jgi:alpha-beta hydrolase superfamily lysophospholipase